MGKDIICTRREIKLTKEQQRRIQRETEIARASLKKDGKRKTIRKEDLKNHKMLVIKIMPIWPEDMIGEMMGLIETGVDEEKKTMKGIRVLYHHGKHEYFEFIFDLDKYGTDWVAFNK